LISPISVFSRKQRKKTDRPFILGSSIELEKGTLVKAQCVEHLGGVTDPVNHDAGLEMMGFPLI
jgi:hypothetical protein